MSDVLKLTVLTPERRLVSRLPVKVVTVPGSEGQIQILPGHADMMGTLKTGIFEYHPEAGVEGDTIGLITTGFFEVKGEELTVAAETLELKGEIDHNRARIAQQKAEEVLKSASIEPDRFEKYQLKLQRSLIRQQLSSKSG